MRPNKAGHIRTIRVSSQPAISLSSSSCCCPTDAPSPSTAALPRPSSATVSTPICRLGHFRFLIARRSPSLCLALGMAKLNPSTNPPSSSKRFLRNRSAISRPPTPSAAVLAVLASLVASADSFPVVCYDSSDPPPSFLCPSLEPQDKFGVQDFVLPPQTPPPSSPVPGPSTITRTDVPAPPVARRVRRNIPAGYTQGDDGRWRKLSTWSLYGSTVCVVRGVKLSHLCPARSFLPVSRWVW